MPTSHRTTFAENYISRAEHRQLMQEQESILTAAHVPREEYNRAMQQLVTEHEAAVATLRDQLQTRENMLAMERNAKRAALRRAEAAELLNHTLVEKLRNLPT